jgi:lipopolysaccharide export system permease protein
LIVDRYIFREIAQTWGAVTLVLLLILISNRVAHFLKAAAAGTLPGSAVLTLVGLAALKYLLIVVPIGLFFAVMLALGRLYRDSEMTALRACGIAAWNIYRPIMLFSLMLTVGLAVLSLEASPWIAATTETVQHVARHRARFTQFEGGQFKSAGDNGIFYSKEVSPSGELLNVFAERDVQGEAQIVAAKSGVEKAAPDDNGQLLVLQHGYRYQGTPGQPDFRIAKFKNYGVRIHSSAANYTTKDIDAKPTPELWNQPDPKARAEVEWRLAIPVSVLVLAFLAVPLARVRPRQGRYGKLFAAILVYIIYQNVLGVARVWVEREMVPGGIGLWWVPGAAVLVALFLLWRQRELRLYPRRVAA